MNRCIFFLILFMPAMTLFAQDMVISEREAYVEFDRSSGEEGFHIWVLDKPGISSILLTESSKDPEGKADSFAFRAYDYNEVNGQERRILDGEFLDPEKELYFIIDSTPEYNEEFEELAYHLFVPLTITYGYSWSREGQVEMTKGTWINIRTFEEPYADYNGAYQDNPFFLDMKELPPPQEPAMIIEEAENIMAAVAMNTEGEFSPVGDPEEAMARIAELIDRVPGGNIDVALVVDTTISMKDDVAFLRSKLVPIVQQRISDFEEFRIGLVFYRDYKEAYLTKEVAFNGDMEAIQYWLDRISVNGGRDKREAVYEGLYSALINLDWQAENKLIIQVGDALPHEEPKGEITENMVYEEAGKQGISIFPILLPED